jgi:capsular polysaccharide biosynthesis protein
MRQKVKRVRLADERNCQGYPLVNVSGQDAAIFQPYIDPFKFPNLDVLLTWNCLVESGRITLKTPWNFYPESCRFIGPVKRSRRLAWVKTYASGERIHLIAPVVSLVNHREWHRNYFHWMVDVLPILLLASKAFLRPVSDFQVVVPFEMLPFQKQSLDALGIPDHARILVLPHQRVSSDGGICLSGAHRFQKKGPQRPHDLIHSLVVELYKEAFLKGKIPVERTRRLLIQRRQGAPRAYSNSEAVADFAKQEGYDLIDLETYDFEAQVKLFSEASHVIGVHGAGFSNLVFASGCRVLEIHSRQHRVRSDFFQLTSLIGGEYRYTVLDADPDAGSVPFPVEIAKAFTDGV